MGLLQKNPYELNPEAVIILLAVEGEVTERDYFNAVSFCVAPPEGRQWQLEIQAAPFGSGLSAPRQVLSRALEFHALHNYPMPNLTWLILDSDVQHIRDLQSGLIAEIKDAGFNLCLSNPCFEVWLWLHEADLPTDTAHIASDLKRHLPLDLTAWRTDADADRIKQAIRRAEALPGSAATPFPDNPGTQLAALFRYLGFAA